MVDSTNKIKLPNLHTRKLVLMGDLTRTFSRKEFECDCGCGFDTADYALVLVLQDCVDHFQKLNPHLLIAARINSGARCAQHNKAEGGSKNSKHLIGQAADIRVYIKDGYDINADAVADYFEKTYPVSHGVGRYTGRTHIDVRNEKARWDNRS